MQRVLLLLIVFTFWLSEATAADYWPQFRGPNATSWVLWKTDRGGPYTPTPIVYGGYLYTVQNNGILGCYDSKTGEKKYETKLDGEYSASPVGTEGKLYFASENGEVSVVKAGPVFQLLKKNEMDAPCFATPAISKDTIFVRTMNHLYAVGE